MRAPAHTDTHIRMQICEEVAEEWSLKHRQTEDNGPKMCQRTACCIIACRIELARLAPEARHTRLRDVEDVPDLCEVGRHVLAAAEREELVVLLERVHQPQRREEVARARHHASLRRWPGIW